MEPYFFHQEAKSINELSIPINITPVEKNFPPVLKKTKKFAIFGGKFFAAVV